MIKLYQFKPAWKLPNPGPFWLGEKASFMAASATSVDAITYSFSCQYLRAFAEISVERSRNVALKLVGLL